jgi:hypothetical protein
VCGVFDEVCVYMCVVCGVCGVYGMCVCMCVCGVVCGVCTCVLWRLDGTRTKRQQAAALGSQHPSLVAAFSALEHPGTGPQLGCSWQAQTLDDEKEKLAEGTAT